MLNLIDVVFDEDGSDEVTVRANIREEKPRIVVENPIIERDSGLVQYLGGMSRRWRLEGAFEGAEMDNSPTSIDNLFDGSSQTMKVSGTTYTVIITKVQIAPRLPTLSARPFKIWVKEFDQT